MSEVKTIQLTAEGKKKLEEELQHLRTVRRQEVAERIQQAKAYGDISESGEYEDAKNEQAWTEGRIRELEQWLSHAEIIPDNGVGEKSIVRIGTRVTIRDEFGEKEIYTLVSSPEAKSSENKISDESPFGAAMVGKRKGDVFFVDAPAGKLSFTIVSID
ncbi:MAG TPA: transcription elongation factor GreA [Chloroflexia bacterium]|nr:transcription elongation factor GreA [Chloroflexia bacterium]